MKRKVLIIVKRLDGGTGTFVLNLIDLEKESNNNFHFDILSLETPAFRDIVRTDVEFFSGKNTYPEKYKLYPAGIITLIREVVWLTKKMGEMRPDITLCVDLHCILINYLALIVSRKRIPMIANIHNNVRDTIRSKSSPILGFILKIIFSHVLKKVNFIICVSTNLSSQVKDYFSLKSQPHTIYNGVTIPRGIKPKSFKYKKKILLCISRFDKQKDQVTLLKAFHMAFKEFPNIELVLVGDGSLKETIRKKVEKMGMSREIKFLDWVQKPETLYQKSDIFILSSKREGLPFVLIEAMSYGLPVISTNSPFGPSEILKEGKDGILVPIGDYGSMKEAIIKLVTNKKMYESLSRKSIKRAKFFSKENMLKNYRKVFYSLSE